MVSGAASLDMNRVSLEAARPIEGGLECATEQHAREMTFVLDRTAGVLERLRRFTNESFCLPQHVWCRHLSFEKLFGRSRTNRSGTKRTKADRYTRAAVAIELQLHTDARHCKVTCSLFELDVRAAGGSAWQADGKAAYDFSTFV